MQYCSDSLYSFLPLAAEKKKKKKKKIEKKLMAYLDNTVKEETRVFKSNLIGESFPHPL